ncbi:hypothetical protein [Halomarina rubra]|uniref:Uncharacterized protein n=1 Tax=Halomarina rubra TaxID=2071873 RepID=A0ABD6AXH9_9EURY|nr:hypothetical protein [Halomarina rubra]
MCHRNTTEEYAYYVLGEREEHGDEEGNDVRVDGEPTRVVRNADD